MARFLKKVAQCTGVSRAAPRGVKIEFLLIRDLGNKAAMTARLKRIRSSGNVFIDLAFDKAEAENLKLRSELMMRIEEFYRKSGMTQAAAAKSLGLTQPRLNALLKGRIGLFSLDALVKVASRAGLNVRLVVRKAA